MRRSVFPILILLVSYGAALAVAAVQQATPRAVCDSGEIVQHVSVATNGEPANGWSYGGAISGDGNYVVFRSQATNLGAPIAPVSYNSSNLFLRRLVTPCETRVITVGYDGSAAHLPEGYDYDYFGFGGVSFDGRYTVFSSIIDNLVPNDTNVRRDIFVYDRDGSGGTGSITRVSVASDGAQANDSADASSISSDGRYVTFISAATNLTSDPNPDGHNNVFLHDRQTGTTMLISKPPTGSANDRSDTGVISGDGRYITFESYASNLIVNDTNGRRDVFVYDQQTGLIERISLNNANEELNADSTLNDISDDGQLVMFHSHATNVNLSPLPAGSYNTYLWDRSTGMLRLINLDANGQPIRGLTSGFLSSDGTVRVFTSGVGDIVAGDTNYLVDVYAQTDQGIFRVSVGELGNEGNGDSNAEGITDDGRFILFSSSSSGFAPNDLYNNYDVFLVDWQRLPNVGIPMPTVTGTRTVTPPYWELTPTPANATQTPLAGLSLTPSSTLTMTPTRTNTPTIPPTPTLELLINGDFTDGLSPWKVYGDIDYELEDGVFRFRRPIGGTGTVVFQETGLGVDADRGLAASFDLGNASPYRQRVGVLLHDADFTDTTFCAFWLPPNMPLTTYQVEFRTHQAWVAAALSFYASTPVDAGWIEIDNVSFRRYPDAQSAQTRCIDPLFAPVLP